MSALLPNLKKASVLDDATNYIRELQDRVKELETFSGLKRKDTKDILVALKRYRLSRDEEDDSNETNSEDDSVGVPSKSLALLSQMQMLGFNIISSSTMPFANTITVITIVAQIEEDFVMTAADLVSKLQLA
ncbi:Myc-type, basic helix-loop-helix domain-containing protein [Tanacetum coccineum]